MRKPEDRFQSSVQNVIDADELLNTQALWISWPGISSRDRKVTGDYDHMQPV